MTHLPLVSNAEGRRRALLCLAVAGLTLLLAGCSSQFPQTIWDPQSEYTKRINGLFIEIIVLGAVVFVLVEGALVFAVLRYRRRPGDKLPPQIHGNTKVEVAWTIAPVIILGAILWPTVQTIFESQAPAPAGSLEVQVTGHQFWWEFTYPSLGVVTANELHLPVGKTVNLSLHSADVLHGFWLPALAAQRNANPTGVNNIWFTPDKAGVYPGECTELCGFSHANMHMRAMVQTGADFNAWVADQKQPASTPPPGTDAAKGAALFQTRGCAGCHTISGTPAKGAVGPNLTHFASRTTLAGAILDNTPDNVRAWLHNPPGVKPGSIMPNLSLSNDELTVLEAYLESLK